MNFEHIVEKYGDHEALKEKIEYLKAAKEKLDKFKDKKSLDIKDEVAYAAISDYYNDIKTEVEVDIEEDIWN